MANQWRNNAAEIWHNQWIWLIAVAGWHNGSNGICQM